MKDTIDIHDLDKSDVLAALYNASRPQGMGFLNYDPQPMTHEEATALLAQTTYFDYLKGRVMKIDISDPLRPGLYDRDNGPGAAERVINELRASKNPNSPTIQSEHKFNRQSAAEKTLAACQEPTRTVATGNVVVMGMEDVADHVIPAVKRAMEK